MTTSSQKSGTLEKLVITAVEQQLGEVKALPKEIVEYLLKVYREFIACYLNVLRQKENRPADWTPETLIIQSELTYGG